MLAEVCTKQKVLPVELSPAPAVERIAQCRYRLSFCQGLWYKSISQEVCIRCTPFHGFLDNNLPDRDRLWTSNVIDFKDKGNYREYSPSKCVHEEYCLGPW